MTGPRALEHRAFSEIGAYLRTGDLLVANDSRVIPARLHGVKATGGQVEVFLLTVGRRRRPLGMPHPGKYRARGRGTLTRAGDDQDAGFETARH
ncbi:MAG: S-adenosylmethionine:tRNA ribosyltransferase-isomerase [Caldilineaceae bacterium]